MCCWQIQGRHHSDYISNKAERVLLFKYLYSKKRMGCSKQWLSCDYFLIHQPCKSCVCLLFYPPVVLYNRGWQEMERRRVETAEEEWKGGGKSAFGLQFGMTLVIWSGPFGGRRMLPITTDVDYTKQASLKDTHTHTRWGLLCFATSLNCL